MATIFEHLNAYQTNSITMYENDKEIRQTHVTFNLEGSIMICFFVPLIKCGPVFIDSIQTLRLKGNK